nr:retrovirus-related Pol polyprotein from transposon TNT 1-94 [Tanacetum cinerariifolium]
MAAVNDVPQLGNKKGGSYAAIDLKLEPGKFNKWKKRMLCYLVGMEPYYLKCIKGGLFLPKIPKDTKENRIMDLKFNYQTFRDKSTKSLSQTYTRYKTLLNEIANDGVKLSKNEINVSFVNTLPEKWLTFSQGLRNVNHTQTLNLAYIYGRIVYEDNLIQRRMVENQNDVKVKQIRTDNGTEFRNHELESFCDEKGISQNFSSPYTPKQNDVAKRKNKTLIKAVRTMLNSSVLSKHFRTKAVRKACYTQNISIILKIHNKTPYELFRERIPDISYFYMFGCHVFIHNHKFHLGKFDAKADDGYFLGYSFVLKAFKIYNMRRKQIKETYHVTFDKSMDTIRFTHTPKDEIGIDDSSRYPHDEFVHEDDSSRQYQTNFNISYYIIPHGRSLFKLSQENYVPEVIALNEPDIPHTEDTEDPPNLTNT